MTLSTFTVNSNGSKQQIPKAAIKYFYKEMDAENLHAAVETDAGIKAQQLCQLPPDAHAEEIDTADVRQAHKNSVPVAITLREGEIFRGTIDWVSPYEIKLILENGSKVVIFRHAVYELLVDEEPL